MSAEQISIVTCICMEREATDPILECHCKDEDDDLDWKWSTEDVFPSVGFSKSSREILFHPRYSSGTAAVKGDTPFEHSKHYYWEIEILTRLYGTDVMVGIGTPNVDIQGSRYKFYSLLGRDAESWGYSYRGTIQHAGKTCNYGPGYCLGDIVGVHLDMWHGTVEFYLNRKSLGIAFTGLNVHKVLYPMVCSTAAHSLIKLVLTTSVPASLMLHCAMSLSHRPDSLEMMRSIPGLRNMFNERFWLLLSSSKFQSDDDDDDDMSCSRAMFRSSTIFGKSTAGLKFQNNISVYLNHTY